MKFILGLKNSDQDMILSRLVNSASQALTQELKRLDQDRRSGLELRSRTEYFSPVAGQRRFYTAAWPIQSITSIYADFTGLYAGGEFALNNTNSTFIVREDGRCVANIMLALNFPPQPWVFTSPKSMRLIYVAGLAAHGVNSDWTKSADVGGSLAVGNYVQGQTSGAVGYLLAAAAGTLTYECVAGVFVAGETLVEYADWKYDLQDGGALAATGVTTTLTACTAQSLCELEPLLNEAVEMQVDFLRVNRHKFNDLTVSENGATKVSRADLKNKYRILPEIDWMIEKYRNKLVA